jgi:aromatase
MAGYTENRILIYRDFDHVFDLSNRIDLWPKLFTEYKEAEILEREDNTLTFRLTTFEEGERPSRTWVSKRLINKKEGFATAERIDPLFPFLYMKIRWEYEKLLSDKAVVMTWIQEFDVHPECKFTDVQMESFLNHNTYKQMRCVKEAIEGWE